MIYSSIPDYSLIDNINIKGKNKKNSKYNKYKYPNFERQNFIYCQFYQKYYIQNFQNYIFWRSNFPNYYQQQLYKENNSLNKENKEDKEDKEDNSYDKINTIKLDKKRKPSIDTTISTNSFNSTSNEENTKINQEGQQITVNQKNKDKTENGEYEGNPEFENTVILLVNVKISKDKIAIFKLKRYDDVFETIKLFCEINLIDENLIKPLIIKSLNTLNTIYQIMNCKLDNRQINLLKNIKSN